MGIFSKKPKGDGKEKAKEKKEKAAEPKTEMKKSMKDLYEGGGARTTATTAKTEAGKKEKKDRISRRAHFVLVKPLITEKAANVGALNKYVFMVANRSNKIEVAKAIEEVYGIKPVNVNIIRIDGKKVRYGKTLGQRKDWKKAIVTLPTGKTINIYEGV